MLRITVTAKAELEDYIKEQIDKTGMGAGTITYFLAMDGLNYRKAIDAVGRMDEVLKKLESIKDEVEMSIDKSRA